MNVGPARTASGQMKTPFRQSKGILRNAGEDTARPAASQDNELQRLNSKAELPSPLRSGSLSRSGSLQRVVSFEDEKLAAQERNSRPLSSARASSYGELRPALSRNDLETVREVPNSETLEMQDGEIQPAASPEVRQPSSAGRSPAAASRGFVRHPSQEPKFRTHSPEAGPSSFTRPERSISGRAGSRELGLSAQSGELQGKAGATRVPGTARRTGSGRLPAKRAVPPAREALEQRGDKWEKEAARLKALEDHMRSALTPRTRDKSEAPVRRPAEGVRTAEGGVRQPQNAPGSRGNKPSLEEMLVLIEDARKLYSPGSETRNKLDQ